ncbi:hypothetical protein Mro03_57490 [Microbispora rosea subsp. rosea]|nr:hypothetical protein Mro03_57490 [Microbispora rosea subsp. rosea]
MEPQNQGADGMKELDRHTTKRIFDRLLGEHQAAQVSYQMVPTSHSYSRRSGARRRAAGRGLRAAIVTTRRLASFRSH